MMEFILSMLGDEFLSKAFVLSFMTGLFVSLRNVPRLIWARIKRLIVFSVTIEQTDELFDYIEVWLSDNYQKKYRNVLAAINYRNFALDESGRITSDQSYKADEGKSFYEENNVEKASYRHNQDIIFIRRNGIFIKIDKSRDKLEHAKSFTNLFFDRYVISTFFYKQKLQKLIDEIIEYNQQFKKKTIEKVTIWNFDGYNNWSRVRNLNPKKMRNIVLDKDKKDLILGDVDKFMSRKKWYNERCIPYKRGYLFKGVPGNGKTSLSMALAHHLKKDIYTLSISEVKGDGDLKYLFNNIDSNSILLIEDIDAAFSGRKSKDKVSFSGLLNCLDGIYYKEGIITIMTTNHADKLDPALMRDGRVDLQIKFDNPAQKEVKEYVELFYAIKLNGQIYNKEYSMSKIQNYCLSNNEHSIIPILFN